MKNDFETQKQITNSTLIVIDSSIIVLSQLLENMKHYRDCVNTYFQLQQENGKTEIKSFPAIIAQSYNLPGVISTPQVSKNESDKQEEVQRNIEKTLQQKRVFFRLVDKSSNSYLQAFKELKNNDACFEQFIDILNGNINLDLQPQPVTNRAKQTKPSFKLEVKNNTKSKKE
jgi:hypothetical protein